MTDNHPPRKGNWDIHLEREVACKCCLVGPRPALRRPATCRSHSSGSPSSLHPQLKEEGRAQMPIQAEEELDGEEENGEPMYPSLWGRWQMRNPVKCQWAVFRRLAACLRWG